jgi:hypothetical protein
VIDDLFTTNCHLGDLNLRSASSGLVIHKAGLRRGPVLSKLFETLARCTNASEFFGIGTAASLKKILETLTHRVDERRKTLDSEGIGF